MDMDKIEKLTQIVSAVRRNRESIPVSVLLEIDDRIDISDLSSLVSSSYSDRFVAEVALRSTVPIRDIGELYDLVEDLTFELRRYDSLSENERSTYVPLQKKSESANTSSYSRFIKFCKHPAKHRLIVDWQKYWDHFPTTEEIVIAATTGVV